MTLATLILTGVARAGGDEGCTCETARQTHGWCEVCKVGYVAEIRIRSRLLYEEIDAHGHDIIPASIKCESCRRAIDKDGYCEKCRIGFVGKQAYLSRLTYHLAKGKPFDASKSSCAACRKNAAAYGWCAFCKTGLVGNVVIADRADYDSAVKAYDLVRTAVDAAERCEMCAVAILYDARCDQCKVAYKDGKQIADAPRPP